MGGPEHKVRIVVVEDEMAVRGWVSSVLRRGGYSVLEASGGAEALSLVAADDSGIALVLTDIRMPGMDGVELARRLKRDHPRIKVIFMSGFSNEPLKSDATLLQKPFTHTVLLSEVARMLRPDAAA